jgi:hypothetical protein
MALADRIVNGTSKKKKSGAGDVIYDVLTRVLSDDGKSSSQQQHCLWRQAHAAPVQQVRIRSATLLHVFVRPEEHVLRDYFSHSQLKQLHEAFAALCTATAVVAADSNQGSSGGGGDVALRFNAVTQRFIALRPSFRGRSSVRFFREVFATLMDLDGDTRVFRHEFTVGLARFYAQFQRRTAQSVADVVPQLLAAAKQTLAEVKESAAAAASPSEQKHDDGNSSSGSSSSAEMTKKTMSTKHTKNRTPSGAATAAPVDKDLTVKLPAVTFKWTDRSKEPPQLVVARAFERFVQTYTPKITAVIAKMQQGEAEDEKRTAAQEADEKTAATTKTS